jgi:hypothetical protein
LREIRAQLLLNRDRQWKKQKNVLNQPNVSQE